jgi:hypothetical protein
MVTLCRAGAAFARGASFFRAASDQPVAFHARRGAPAMHSGVGMGIEGAVRPGASPRRVVDEDRVRAPVKAGEAPSPGTEGFFILLRGCDPRAG